MFQIEDFLKEKLQGINIDRWSSSFQTKAKNIDTSSIKISGDRTITLTPGEKIAFYLHSLNDENYKHLINGGFAFPNTPSKINKLTDDDIVLLSKLTPNEKKVADAIYEVFNSIQKKAINEVSVRLDGVENATVEDYFPIRTDYLDRIKLSLLKKEAPNFAQATLEGMGMFKERQNASNAILLDDAFTALAKSSKSAGSYIGLAEPLRTAKALLEDNDFNISIAKIGKQHYIKSLKQYIKDVEGYATDTDNLDKILQEWINKLDVAILGLNPFVIMKQPVSYICALTEMDGKYLKSIKLPSEKNINEINKYAPQIRDRIRGNVTREVGEVMNVGYTKHLFTSKTSLSQNIMRGILEADKAAIVGIWRAAKMEISDKYPDLKGDEYWAKVYDRAMVVIRRTQPTFHIKDRSTIGAKKEMFWRLLTKYSSQRNKNFMMVRRSFEKYNRSHKTPKDKADLASKLLIVAVISPALIYAIDKLRDVAYDRERKMGFLTDAVMRVIGNNIGNIYLLGPAYTSLISKIEHGTFAGYDMDNPVQQTIDQTIDALAEAVNAVKYAISQERYRSGRNAGEMKWKKSLGNSAGNTIDVIGKFRGIPISSIRRLIAAQFDRSKKPVKKRTRI